MLNVFINSAATTNAQRLSQRGVELWTVNAFNAGGAAAFVKLYNTPVTQAAPVVGTDTPLMVLAVPAGGNATISAKQGIQFTKGLGVAITNLAPDSDTTAVAANQIKLVIGFGG